MTDTLPTQQTSLTQIIPSYLYFEYSDDDNLQGFVAAYNSLAQGYLDWFNETPLGVYVSVGIAGFLLDWIAQGIYGIARPVLGVTTTYSIGAINTDALNSLAINGVQQFRSGSAAAVSDDIYKRVLTWWLYRGDGKNMSIDWLKRRLSRFLYGADGNDISYPVADPPSVALGGKIIVSGELNTFVIDTLPINESATAQLPGFTITVPNGLAGEALQQLVRNGLLALPFENNITVLFS